MKTAQELLEEKYPYFKFTMGEPKAYLSGNQVVELMEAFNNQKPEKPVVEGSKICQKCSSYNDNRRTDCWRCGSTEFFEFFPKN